MVSIETLILKLSPELIEEIKRRLDWVRPICGFMRLQGIPEPVIQSTMIFLLTQLDKHLDGDDEQLSQGT